MWGPGWVPRAHLRREIRARVVYDERLTALAPSALVSCVKRPTVSLTESNTVTKVTVRVPAQEISSTSLAFAWFSFTATGGYQHKRRGGGTQPNVQRLSLFIS